LRGEGEGGGDFNLFHPPLHPLPSREGKVYLDIKKKKAPKKKTKKRSQKVNSRSRPEMIAAPDATATRPARGSRQRAKIYSIV
jgi:hypothetical protein